MDRERAEGIGQDRRYAINVNAVVESSGRATPNGSALKSPAIMPVFGTNPVNGIP